MYRGRSSLEAILMRDRLVVFAALAVMMLIAWGYIVWLAAAMYASANMQSMDMGHMDMPGMDMDMTAPAFVPWSPTRAFLTFGMWAVMMVGMMTPSVAPMLLTYTRVAGQSSARGMPFAPVGWFAGGYLSVWIFFAALATALQYVLDDAALLSPMLSSNSPIVGGIFLLIAGLYQWSPLKTACLSQCRAPLAFVQRHGGFKPSRYGSFRLGVLHGGYCVGCCWPLMALLFVGGVMNLFWIATLTVFVLIEKIIPAGRLFSRVTGAILFLAGVWMIAQGAYGLPSPI